MTTHINSILAALTLEQKIELISGNGLWRTACIEQHGINSIVMTDGTYGVRYSTEQIEQGHNWAFDDFIEVINQSAHDMNLLSAEPSLPGEVLAGGSEGLFGRTKPATCFPNGSALACSWDRALIHQMGLALGKECKALKVDLLLGPGINIRRTPLAGRGYEYYSEDPIVSSEMAIAMIEGIQKEGVGACLKHFACNNSEYRRTEMNSVVNLRALYEIYLLAFKRTIQRAKPWAVMSSYNRLNGEQVNESKWLLTNVLRSQFGFDGLVISDWYGIKNRVAALRAGNDLDMPEIKQNKQQLIEAFARGEFHEYELNQACRRMLLLLEKAGKLGQQPTDNYPDKIDFFKHHQLAIDIAAASIVLLKNDKQILPITPEKYTKIAVIGKWAHEPVIQGSGSATTTPYYVDRPLDELMDLGADLFEIRYAIGAPLDYVEDENAIPQAIEIAAAADIALIFVNTAIGEDGEDGDRSDLDLLPTHQKLIEHISNVQKNCVVIMANSDAVVMPWLDKVSGVVETFFGGQGVGGALAKILLGVCNPCGKLTITVPNRLEETPSFLYYPGEAREHYYSEGIFVGYRYYDKRDMQPCFPFGFGLSYSEFMYSNLRLSTSVIKCKGLIEWRPSVSNNDLLVEVSLDVKNLGPFDGHEIVQLYLAWPVSRFENYPRERKSLKTFAKCFIANQETTTIQLQLTLEDFSYYHTSLDKFVIDSGEYHVLIGASSRDIQLEASIIVQAEPYIIPLEIDCSLVKLMEQPMLFENVVKLVETHTGKPSSWIKEKFESIAPNLFCGLYITLTEFFQIRIDPNELKIALGNTLGEVDA
ncbi:beta-glucosidase [Thorsellia anophelis]|uniref:Beta-glucosidase n=1 Tax=Thorsellia anophelis DSM 18579 TaxID=1123402 RepID=A0A1I0AEH1_9GAMM|nr:glycoside hydrolase family 3 C-terminal domain-containing protein [Thorsellia anophelis]SES92507.1 beta-glucosidase [Thorsellia anophelis DSM 18579]